MYWFSNCNWKVKRSLNAECFIKQGCRVGNWFLDCVTGYEAPDRLSSEPLNRRRTFIRRTLHLKKIVLNRIGVNSEMGTRKIVMAEVVDYTTVLRISQTQQLKIYILLILYTKLELNLTYLACVIFTDEARFTWNGITNVM